MKYRKIAVDCGWRPGPCSTPSLASGRVPRCAELTVENSGPVIPAYDVPVLFEPFRRLGEERLVTAKGAGLGLSIVRSVAHAAARSPRALEGGGLIVTVTLPTPSAPPR